jgi:hypothetical protein
MDPSDFKIKIIRQLRKFYYAFSAKQVAVVCKKQNYFQKFENGFAFCAQIHVCLCAGNEIAFFPSAYNIVCLLG